MKTLVFSDTHLTGKFNERLFNALKKRISEADRVIINGDFWEGLGITFDEFIRSGWNQLFPLLKQKHAVYVYGNHDYKGYSDERVSLFCDIATDSYVLETANGKYLFNHGHELLFPKHTEECLRKHMGEARTFQRRLRLYVASVVQTLAFGIFGPNILPKYINYISAEGRRSAGDTQSLLVCGHTHRPYYNGKSNFIDIGFFNYGWANYLIIDDNGRFRLVSERY